MKNPVLRDLADPVNSVNKIYYLAYGSNLHPVRLQKRVPSAVLVGSTKLTHSCIVFHKRGQDDSGKCMLLTDATYDQHAYAVLYCMDAAEQGLLDQAEGYGKGYLRQTLQCVVKGMNYTAFTYIAQAHAVDPELKPYHWYKALVLAGVRYHQFPNRYLSEFEMIESIDDPDEERVIRNYELLKVIG